MDDNNSKNTTETNIPISISTNEYENKYDASIVSTQKFNSTKWNMIEKPLTETEKKRNQIILKLGENTSTSTNELTKNNIIMIGDYYYQIIKSKISTKIIDFNKTTNNDDVNSDTDSDNETNKITKKTKSTKTKTKTKIKEKPISSTLKTKLNNIQDTLNKKLDILIKLLEDKPETKIYSDLMNNLNIIEYRILILMKIIQYYTKLKKAEISDVEELVLGSKKILRLLKDIKENKNNEYENYFKKICNFDEYNISLSNDMINDLENVTNILTTKYGIKLFDVANTRPKLIFDTKYDETIPNMKLKPYDSQIELSNIIKKNISNGFLIFYKTLPGLGKTSMILSICSYIKKSNSDLKIIFCCSDLLESVRVQVLRLVFNFGIKFGIATSSSKSDDYKITNSWNCSKDVERELIVADYKSTYLILKDSKTTELKSKTKSQVQLNQKYLLFFDEPTVLTDQVKNSTTLSYLAKILYYIPSHTILSSATLPMLNELELLTTHYQTKYPTCIISEVVSNKTLIGCVIKDFNSNPIVPHSGCKNQLDLKNIILKIKKFPLLGKFYTLPFLMNLNNFCSQYNYSINLDSIETFDQDSVLENILILLERISNIDSIEIFNKFIGLKINDIQDDIFDLEKIDIDFNKIIPSKLLTSHAFKYLGCCLIATTNPLNYAKTHLYSTVDKLKVKIKVDDINKKYQYYLTELIKYNEQIDKIKAKYTSDDKIEEEVVKLKIPKFEFDKRLEINTELHIKSLAKYVKSYDSSMVKSNINFEKINITEFDIDDNLKFLLYMGVGLFSKDLDPSYTNKILEMLQNCELAYIIADESFCYGANYLISNVIINDDIGDPHSINTILQLIGRTARVGKSWSGKVYLDTNTSIRIKEFFMNPSFNSIEGTNIIKYLSNTIEEIEQIKQIKQNEHNEQNEQIKQNEKEQLIKIIPSTQPTQTIKSKPIHFLNNINNSQINNEQIKIIKPNNNEDHNENCNEIHTWRRGKNFKLTEHNEPTKLTNAIDTINTIKSSESSELWTLNSNHNQETKPKVSEEFGIIRGKYKTTQPPKQELFKPKTVDELNILKSNLTNQTKTNTNTQNQTTNYNQFENINMFTKNNSKQSKVKL